MNLRSAPGLAYYFWVGVALIIIFSVMEPSGTKEAGILTGFFVWTMQIGILLPMLIGLHIWLQKITIFNELNSWLKLTISGFLGSVLFVPLGIGVDYLFSLDDWSSVKGSMDVIAMIMEEASGILFPVTFTWAAINAPRILQLNFQEKNAAESPTQRKSKKGETPSLLPQFCSLIPVEIGDNIVFLKAELHYVRVVTAIGEKLVLYNLKDAISDMEKIAEGIQTHRSYWVAGAHVKKLIHDRNRKYVLMSNDQKVPVSRRKSNSVKDFIQRRRSLRSDGGMVGRQ